MNPAIQQSLQEIASLLLIVHDDYLKGVVDGEILSALVELIDDVGLGSQVSMLDAERLRRSVMKNSDADMGYELFYDWLRGVGQLVSRDRDVGGKKALHYLLTQYIIPFASTLGTRSSSSVLETHGLPYYTSAALKVMSDCDAFLVHWFYNMVAQRAPRCTSVNHSVWLQISISGSHHVNFLPMIGNLTKYSVVPDLLTDDQAESILQLANTGGSSSFKEDCLSFPSFLYYLELLTQAVPDSKLTRRGGDAFTPESGEKLQALLVRLAGNMLQRRSFEHSLVAHGVAGREAEGGMDEAVAVFDEDLLQHAGVAEDRLLRWLRATNALQVPHVQIPLVLQYLSSLATAHPAWVLADAADPARRTWRASELSSVLYAVVKQLTTLGAPVRVSRAHEVLYLVQHLPGVFFIGPTEAAAVPSLHGLYSGWSAALLHDSVEQLNSSLNAMWSSFLFRDAGAASEEQSARSEAFVGVFGTARVKVHCALRVLIESGLVPAVVTPSQFFAACGAMLGEDPDGFDEECNISQGRLFDALYALTCDHWFALENLRRKKPLTAAYAKLSAKSPQREQQIFQTFMFLLEMRFNLQVPAPPPLPAEAERHISGMGNERSSVPSSSAADVSPVVWNHETSSPSSGRKTALQIISEMINQEPSAAEARSIPNSVPRLTVSFNSNRHLDGLPVRQQGSAATSAFPFRSFFSEHPLRDIAVLLAHYPVPGFSLSPWAMLGLLRENSEAFPLSGYGNPSANTDALLTSLLSKFCLRFHVSSNDLSQFFANYYLAAEESPASSPETGAASTSQPVSTTARFKEDAVRCAVMDCLMTERCIEALSAHADLLKWEYARCYAQCRSTSDPFLQGTVCPFLTEGDFERDAHAVSLPQSSLKKWASQRCEQLSQEDVQGHIEQVTCLSGATDLSTTFSAFVLFVVRCITHSQLRDKDQPNESAFCGALEDMLAVFSESMHEVQKVLNVDIAKSLFEDIVDLSACSADMLHSVVSAALDQFSTANASSTTVPAVTPSGAPMPGDGRLPPRPPKMLWDAPRFVQFCRDVGILAKLQVSATAAWATFGTLLRQEDTPGVGAWADGIVSPVPVRVGVDVVHKLVATLSTTSNENMGVTFVYHKTIIPVLCALVHPGGVGRSKAAQEGLKIEDMLRYGGSALMGSLAGGTTTLQRTFARMCEESASALCTANGVPVVASGHQAEVSLAVLCRFLGCSGLLRPAAVAVQAKRSLHVRLRPGFCALTVGQQALQEVVTLSYSEFEELALRAAFLLFEVSTALIHVSHLASESTLLGQAHLQQLQPGPAKEATGRAAEAYVMACAAHSVAERQVAEASAGGKRPAWGVDFLGPYLALLKAAAGAATKVASSKQEPLRPPTESTESARRSKGKVSFGKDVVLNEGEREYSPEMRNAVDTNSGKPFLSVARDTFDSPKNGDPLLPSQGPTGIAASQRYAVHSRLSSSPLGEWRDRDSPDLRQGSNSSPSPKLQPSQRIIQTSTERFLQRQESSEQFVVAVDALLVGTKEALWPVYATYCSCGDSLEPGKLSGPNLFTLLSKLDVLTDRTSLSDVGILLHQTAAHQLTEPSTNAVAMLYEAGEGYFEAPSLTFEEFIVFLCAFSQLRYQGEMMTPEQFRLASGGAPSRSSPGSSSNGLNPDNWFKQWQEFMGKSDSFRHLLAECVLPILQKQMLLAFPEDARLRDRFCCVFSVEVLIAVEGVESPLLKFFETERARERSLHDSSGDGVIASSSGSRDNLEISAIIVALKRINLIPKVMGEPQVLQLIQDVLPEQPSKRRAADRGGGASAVAKKPSLLFPQWEWVLSVVAFQAVVTATEQSAIPTDAEKIPAMVADVITSIAAAITQDH